MLTSLEYEVVPGPFSRKTLSSMYLSFRPQVRRTQALWLYVLNIHFSIRRAESIRADSQSLAPGGRLSADKHTVRHEHGIALYLFTL